MLSFVCLVSSNSGIGLLGHCRTVQWKRMSMALSAFGIFLMVSSVCVVALSVCIGARAMAVGDQVWLVSVTLKQRFLH